MCCVARRLAAGALVASTLLAVAACSSDESSGVATPVVAPVGSGGAASTAPAIPDPSVPTSSTSAAASPSTGADGTVAGAPRIDLIATAIAAVEQRLGAPQRYFEVNATSSLVNVIVALNRDTLAQTWLYLDGVLSSNEPQPAEGDTFAAADVGFDPANVLSKVAVDLPDAALDLFFVTAPGGTAQYRLVVTSAAGGQLIVQLAGDGQVLAVEPASAG